MKLIIFTPQIFPLFVPEIPTCFMSHIVKFRLDPVTVAAQVASFYQKNIEHCPTMVYSASVLNFD
jgi:hypothetical protein